MRVRGCGDTMPPPYLQQDEKNLDNGVRKKTCIVLSARVHPGETNASWMMKGCIGLSQFFVCMFGGMKP